MRSLLLIITFCSALIGAHLDAGAQPARSANDLPLFVARFDFDCALDTLFGIESPNLGYMATAIRWGEPSGDSCADQIVAQDRSRPHETLLDYPAWLHLDGSTTVLDVNSDRVDDIVLTMSGRDAATGRDTSRSLILFGQNDLHALGRFDLGMAGDGLRSTPVITCQLSSRGILERRALRDPGGVPSYEWSSIAAGTGPQPGAVPDARRRNAWMQLAPNPAVYTTTLELRDIEKGDYDVAIIGLDGITRAQQTVHVDDGGGLFRTLDLGNVPSGYYRVRVGKLGKEVGSWPVVVVH